MEKGKFSGPRHNREEDRLIEETYRKLTGKPPLPEEPEIDLSFLPEDILNAPEEDFFQPEIPDIPDPVMPEVPTELDEDWEEDGEDDEEEATFLDRLILWGGKAMDFCSRNRNVALVVICAAALALIVGIISVFFASASDPYDRLILNNVYIAGVNVGGMSKQEAISAVTRNTAGVYAQQDMVVNLSGMELRLRQADSGVALNVKSAVNAAYDYGRKGTNAEKQQAYESSFTENYYLPLMNHLELNQKKLREHLEGWAKTSGSTVTQTQYGLEGKQPELAADKFDENAPVQTLVITMGTPGIEFDPKEVLDQILIAYDQFSFQVTIDNLEPSREPDPLDLEAVYEEFYIEPVDAQVIGKDKVDPGAYGYGFDLEEARKLLDQAQYGDMIRIPMEYIEPEILSDELHFLDVLGEYQTTFKKNSDRAVNIRLASEVLNGQVLESGESFSFHAVLGKPSGSRGFQEAPIDAQEEETILGGGISQVSSTLYCAALLGDLDIQSRSPHAYPVSFINYGLDADVRWGGADLKFRNNTDQPMKIEALVSGSSLTIRLLGTDNRDHYVKLEHRIENTYVPDTEYKDFEFDNKEGYEDGDVIQEGRSGYLVKVYKLFYDKESNKLIDRQEISQSRYKTVNELVARVAPEETTEATTEATEPPTESTEPPTEATVPPTQPPTETTVPPTEPPTAPPTEPPTQATQPPAQETQPSTDPTA